MSSRRDADLTGLIIGRLTVLSRAADKIYKGDKTNGKHRTEPAWLCRCECGRSAVIAAANLIQASRHGKGRGSNACNFCARHKPGASFRKVLNQYRGHAKERGHQFLLTDRQSLELLTSDCFYCGAAPSNVKHSGAKLIPELSISFTYSGLDRKDNSLGYTLDNCVSCCFVCNRAKMNRDTEDFIQHCKRIAERF